MTNQADVDYPGTSGDSGIPLLVQGSERDVPLVFLYQKHYNNSPVFITKLLNQIIDISVSYSISATTALTFRVIDPGFELTTQNYFQVGTTFIYRSHNSEKIQNAQSFLTRDDYLGYFMEIADVTFEQEQGNSPIVRVQAYTKAVQQMKRDRKADAIKGDAFDYVQNAAKKYGLKSVCQRSSQTRRITQASGEKQADSVWDVLNNLAGETKDENKNSFILFESDGTLYFCTQQWLLYKWGVDSYEHTKYNKKKKKDITTTRRLTYLHYPPRLKDNGQRDDRFILMKMPSIHKAENDPMEGDGSCIVDRLNGVRLRPGMTVNVGSIPWHTDDFLITSVDYQEMVQDPVSVNFATPPRLEKNIKQIEVGTIYPGSVEWSTVEGLHAINPQPSHAGKSTNSGETQQYE